MIKCIHISYHILEFVQQKKIKCRMESSLHVAYAVLSIPCRTCWCPRHSRSQDISRHGIDLLNQNIPSLASEGLKWYTSDGPRRQIMSHYATTFRAKIFETISNWRNYQNAYRVMHGSSMYAMCVVLSGMRASLDPVWVRFSSCICAVLNIRCIFTNSKIIVLKYVYRPWCHVTSQ